MLRALATLALLAAIAFLVWVLQPAPAMLTVYCAHDALYAGPFLRRFTEETGITVDVRFDTEATKSLGLTERIVRERERPRCDVFWNNESLGTVRLAADGLLVPYRGSGFARIPTWAKHPDGLWTGFAARLRVWILHEPSLPRGDDPQQWLAGTSLAHVAVAKPLYGTTRTHLTALWDQVGERRAVAWWTDLEQRGAQVVGGNAQVKDAVAAGRCTAGLTDTDDFFVARDAGRPVRMVPARLPDGSVVCIPNTVAIVRGCRDLPAARRLVDYLTSAGAELALAASRSRQIPLGPAPAGSLPAEVRPLRELVDQAYGFRDLAASSRACLAWLKTRR